MKTKTVSKFIAVAACIAAFSAAISTGRASLLVYEGYNGYTNGSLSGQAISANTIGLDTTTNYSSGTAVIQFQSTGLSFGDLAVSGGSLIQKSTTAASVGGKLLSSVPATTGSVYVSYLVSIDHSPSTDVTPTLQVGTATTITGTTRTLMTYADAGNTVKQTGITYASGVTTANSSQILGTGTYLILSRFTNVGSDLSVASGTATLWALTLDQFQNFELGGFSDAALDAATVGSGATNVTSMVQQTVSTGTYNISNYLQVGMNSNSAVNGYTLDEVRLGTSLTDVIVTVPEPSTSVFLIMGSTLLLGVTMRRRSIA